MSEAYRDSYSVNFRPLHATWYSSIEPDGTMLEIDVIVERIEDWPSRRESKDPTWRPVQFTGTGLLVAVKVLV